VALLKPIASAVTIGTGGPFGAEGPIIMTGGAFGSISAQLLHLSADERKTLLVAGAAAGMAATFDAPLASIMLAVELLLFEWRPRSFIPVAAAVAVATAVRIPLLGSGPIFPMPTGSLHLDAASYALCIVSGAVAGLLALLATSLVYLSEDTFARLPIHWMWWPAIGGVIIGIGGLIVPQALGVGYDVIGSELNGTATVNLMVGILIVKTLIWSLSLGSGTSGGVLAPMLMIGGALGGLQAEIFPHVAAGFWPLVGLAGVLGGVMRSPLTGVIFALELTHRYDALLPLVIGATAAYAVSILVLRRSVLTEKIARRGVHLTREYSVDPLEVLFVGDVMSEIETAVATTNGTGAGFNEAEARLGGGAVELDDAPIVFADDTLRHVAYVMADSGRTELPVAERSRPEAPIGTVRLEQLLKGRLHDLDEERHRTRVLRPLELLRAGRPTARTGGP
jgi:H+/Cl- antiporter ClcA